jgi:basic membrane protein A
MKKKVIAIVLAIALIAALCVGFAACNKNNGNQESKTLAPEIVLPEYDPAYADLTVPSDFKVGLITLHDKNSTYDRNFIEALELVKAELGLSDSQVIIRSGVEESEDCYTAATQLVAAGCKLIFADSFGHEDFMLQAARENPTVQFCHATGTQAHTAGVANFANAFASIYEGRYLAGVAAGLKLQAMGKTDAPKIGYVGAHPYAEVISGYTSFFLGVRSIVPTATMEVTYTGSWYDETAENNAATMLIGRGCVLISQHADSMGAPNACEEAGVPDVSYNGSTYESCPNTFLVSSRIDWAPYYKYAIKQVVSGQPVAKDWNGTLANGGVKLTNLGTATAPGTVAKLCKVRNELAAGTVQVFDVSKFTVNNQHITEYQADVNSDAAFTPDTQVVKTAGGITYVAESDLEIGRSAPYFAMIIDGITVLGA